MAARAVDEAADDVAPEAASLVVGVHGDVGDVRAVEAVGEGAPGADERPVQRARTT